MITLTASLLLFRRTLSVSMAAVLLGTSSPGLEAATDLFRDTQTASSDSLTILNTQALNARTTFIHSAAGPSLVAWSFVMKSRNVLIGRSFAGQSSSERSGLSALREALGIVLRTGHYGFSLLNEWGHLTVAFILFPYKATSIFTANNLRGNQSWSEFWARGLVSSDADRASPNVALPFVKSTMAHDAIRVGGFVLSLVPLAALAWFGTQFSFGTALDPFGLITILVRVLSMIIVLGTTTSVLSAWWSDILFADVPGQYNCGNLFLNILTAYHEGKLGLQTVVDLELPVTVGEKVLEPGYELPPPTHVQMTVEELLMHMLSMLDVRGRLQAGIVLYHMNGTITTKINTPKRSPLNEALLRRFVSDANRAGKFEFEDGILRISAHVRAPTQPAKSKKLETVSAQPQQYQLDRLEWVGEFVAGSDGKVTFIQIPRKIIVKQGHNGDGDQMIIHSNVLDKSDHMYAVLDKVFGLVGTEPVGDSKALSGLMDLFFVQGRGGASARLAYHTQVIQTIDQKTDQVLFPSQDLFANVGAVLASAIKQQTELRRLGGPNMTLSHVPESQLIELKSRLLRTVVKDSERASLQSANNSLPTKQQLHKDLIDSLMYAGGSQSIVVDASSERGVKDLLARPLADRLVWIDSMVDAYFKNTLYEATSKAMMYMEGTFGIVLETVDTNPDNEETVVFARGQNMSLGWDSSGKFNFGASSRQALDLLRFQYHLSNEGQVFGISFRKNPNTGNREFKFRSRLEKKGGQDLTSEQIEADVIDRHGNRWMESPPVPYEHHDDLMLAEMMQIPSVYNAFLESLVSPVAGSTYHASNLHTLKTLIDILNEIATGKRQPKIVITGSEKSGEAGKTLIKTIQAMTSADQMSAKYVSPSDVLKWVGAGWLGFVRKKLGLSLDTLGIVISASGGDTFETARSAEVMTRFLKDIIVYAGLWNIELAEVMGQKLKASSPPSGRIQNSKGGWSTSEVSTLPDAAMEFSINQTWLRAFREVKAEHPDSEKLEIDLETEDFDLLLGKITDDYLEHTGRILGIKMNGRQPALDDAGQPIAEETPEHQAIMKDAERFALHSSEGLVLNNLILPVFYSTLIYLGFHFFPSAWSSSPWNPFSAAVYVWQHSIGLLPFVMASWKALSHVDLWFWQKMPVAVQMILTFGGTLAHASFFIVSNAVFVALIPLVWMRIYRAATGREGRRRGGTAVAVLVDRARDKIMNLYAKPQASMFNQQEPFFISATLRSVLHNFSFRIRRGTLVIMSMSSPEGIDQSERNASIMVRNQAEMVKSQGTGAEIITFDHLPYSVPIRAPYENYVKNTAKELKFSPEQTLQLRDFVAQLPETISDFKRTHRDKLLDDLPRAVGVMLGLDGERLELFKAGFDHYMERQFALEEVFRTNFGDAENWLKHYVFAHAWAKANATAWYIRYPLKAFDIPVIGKPMHNFIKDHAPVLNLYVDISRTFVGTGRLTTASPFDGSVAAKIMHLPSKLVDRSASLPTTVAANVVPFAAKPVRLPEIEIAEPLPANTEPMLAAARASSGEEGTATFDDVFGAIKKATKKKTGTDGRKGTSVVIKAAGQPTNFSTQGELYLNKDGNVISEAGFPVATKKVIERVITTTDLVAQLAKTGDQRPLGFTIVPISNRPSYFSEQGSQDELSGLILVDSHLVDSVEQGEEKCPGSADALYLELWDEVYHAAGIMDENQVQLAKLFAFGHLSSDARRVAVMKYWEINSKKEHGYHLVLKQFQKIYKAYMKAHDADLGLLEDRKTDEGKQKLKALKEDAIVEALQKIDPDLKAYLERISGEEPPKVESEELLETDTVGEGDPAVGDIESPNESVLPAASTPADSDSAPPTIQHQAPIDVTAVNAPSKFQILRTKWDGVKVPWALKLVPVLILFLFMTSSATSWFLSQNSRVTAAVISHAEGIVKLVKKDASAINATRNGDSHSAVQEIKVPSLSVPASQPAKNDGPGSYAVITGGQETTSKVKKPTDTKIPDASESAGSQTSVQEARTRDTIKSPLEAVLPLKPLKGSEISGLNRTSSARDPHDIGDLKPNRSAMQSGYGDLPALKKLVDQIQSESAAPGADELKELRRLLRFLEMDADEHVLSDPAVRKARELLKKNGGSALLMMFKESGVNVWSMMVPFFGLRRKKDLGSRSMLMAA